MYKNLLQPVKLFFFVLLFFFIIITILVYTQSLNFNAQKQAKLKITKAEWQLCLIELDAA